MDIKIALAGKPRCFPCQMRVSDVRPERSLSRNAAGKAAQRGVADETRRVWQTQRGYRRFSSRLPFV